MCSSDPHLKQEALRFLFCNSSLCGNHKGLLRYAKFKASAKDFFEISECMSGKLSPDT